MGTPTLAWSEVQVFGLPDGSHLYGREFELLPSGSMFGATSILRGLIGIEAEPTANGCRIYDGAAMLLFGMGDTPTEELSGYRNEVVEGFRIRQAADAS